ncbi:hypothetical protein EJ02DRAFT_456184 [Clathrospora elynae]|uniref:Actin cytoskeleton-regulatory complex protein SLA1 n=1 Tax=Clathrospora elynae TaxID=706981 RepID=A0A6A5SKP9_9PLEO|nr:hypothetical protein EJ02DRAFT_456184 [Clathrospora elynae]
MVFLGIYRAIYDYEPQSSNEIALNEGDILMVLEKSADDDWWKAKKKGREDDEEEPEGLIPNNYIEEAGPVAQAHALFDYDRQTDEELSFKEEALLDVYDTSDPDWTLVGIASDYGFAPANYIQLIEGGAPSAAPAKASSAPPTRPSVPAAAASDDEQPPTPDSPPRPSPAAALAGIIQQKSEQAAPRLAISPSPNVSAPPRRRVQFTPEESDEEAPAPTPRLPQRPPSEAFSSPPTQYARARSPSPPARSPPSRSVTFDKYDPPSRDEQPATPMSGSGYHLYNIYEYITQPGKNKKMPITLGINIPKGMIMIAPEKSRDGPQQEWSAEKMEYYSQEGKHIFMELKQPSKSVDFHCGAKDTASEIMLALGELAGAAKGAGLREVLAAGSGNSNVQKKGVMLFDFMAQGEDEVTVGLGDEILVLDDSASDEWWKVRRLKNGKEGVVPANYVEITETVPVHAPAAAIARSGTNAGRSVVEQNRREEEELARQALRRKRPESEARNDQRSSKRESSSKDSSAKSSSKPNTAKVRTWTDRSGSFKVEAEFILIKDGKIHLHKVNGVKIAVPVTKMSVEDLEYVEGVTGESLDDDKPLSDLKKKSTLRAKEPSPRSPSGITVEKKPEYDWFDFFLKCGVNPQICERYARAFHKDEMTEDIIPDITPALLRTLGLKEGDILRVTKYLDAKVGRNVGGRSVSFAEDGGEAGPSGLFSGPGGALRNNTRKGRPAPPVETNDIVDAKAFEQKPDGAFKKPADATPTPDKKADGFDDNAWDVKPSKSVFASGPPPAASPPPAQAALPATRPPALTGSMSELSLLDMPVLKPDEIVQPAPPAPAPPQVQAPQPAPVQQPQPIGATPTLFEQVAAIKALTQPQNMAPPRMRPQAPQQQNPGGLIAPPPQRSSSAPQNPQQSAFGPPPPLQPQLTGYNPNPNMMTQVSGQGQSMQEMQNMQNMQTMQHMHQQMTGFPQQNGSFGFQQNGMMPQPTGYNSMSPPPQQPMQTGFAPFQQPQPTGFQQPTQTGFQPQGFQQGFGNGSPFADPPRAPFQSLQAQATGYNTFQPSPLNPQATGVNRFLPPALVPQPTGFMSNQSPPPMPPMPPMSNMPIQPLVPQKTGPPPTIKFGVQQAKKLTPQPTGRANLANATPQNPFGF